MNQYSVLLVDDEEDVIRVIMKKIDWEALGFTVCGYAHNGLEALEIAEQQQPDVVMTDIKMPYMGGLELSRRLKQLYPTVRILIFSGFDEFEYAKEAIRVEAEEYMLKPLNAEELTGVFRRIRDSLDRELSEKRSVEKLQNYYMESLPLLQENFFASLIEGRIPEQELKKYIEDYRIDLTGPNYCAAVIHTSTTHVPEGISPMLLAMAVRKLAEERFAAAARPRFFTYLGNTVAIVQLTDESAITELTNEGDRFCRLAKYVCNATVTMGIGTLCSRLGGLQQSYEGAREAVSYRVLYGTEKAINISEITPHDREPAAEDNNNALHALFRAVKMETPEEIRRLAEQYVSENIASQPSLQNHHFFLMELISELYRFAINNQLDMEESFSDSSKVYTRVLQMEEKQLQNWLGELCVSMWEKIRVQRSDTTRSFVDKAVEYVHDNYHDQELTVEKVCSVLGVSSAYFSTVFKKETGRTFISFLTDYRMEKAVHLLVEKNEKTYVIARQVGYSDPNYFSYVFKKQFGVSPSKYKDERK